MVFEGWFLILCSRAQPTVVAGFLRHPLVLFQIKEMHLSEQVDSPHHAAQRRLHEFMHELG
jgi:hypothetical protein